MLLVGLAPATNRGARSIEGRHGNAKSSTDLSKHILGHGMSTHTHTLTHSLTHSHTHIYISSIVIARSNAHYILHCLHFERQPCEFYIQGAYLVK